MGSVAAQELDRIWGGLRDGILEVYAHREMTSERYMELYTFVYNFCAKYNRPQEPCTENREEWEERRISARRRGTQDPAILAQNFDGHDLYHRIQDLIRDYLSELAKSAEDKNGEDLVRYYLTHWEMFTFSSKVVNGFCSYLNRHWIPDQQREGRSDILLIYSMTLELWKEAFFEAIHKPVIHFILQLITRNRQGELVDSGMIKSVTGSLIELGKDPTVDDSDDMSMYRRRFEEYFIDDTERYYVQESNTFLDSLGSVAEYMKTVENYILEETRRVSMHLHATTLNRLMDTCVNVLIVKKIPALQEEFPKLLKAEDMDGMGRMYDLVSKVPDSFGNMRAEFQEHIASTGRAQIEQNRDECNKSSVEYVRTLMEVFKKYHGLVFGPFKEDPGFTQALDKGCSAFINDNPLTSEPGSARKSPVMLAKYCDFLLKKSAKVTSDEEQEQLLTDAIAVFKFLEDKDVFQQHYSRLLAKRLIDDLSSSDDAETYMLNKLKLACGYEYTLKQYKMFQDMSLSRDKNAEFREWLTKKRISLTVDFSMKVLQSGSWPFNADSNDHDFELPAALVPCVTRFGEFYSEKTDGRALRWLHSKSKGEVTSNKDVFGGTPYSFVLPTYGIGILLQYNSRDTCPLEELTDATKLDEDIVKTVVGQLMKAKLLKSEDPFDKLTSDSMIALNRSYKNKKRKVNLAIPLKSEVKLDDERTNDKVEKERIHEVSAAIVRVMKARKSLNIQKLISEVVIIMKGRFSPSVKLIKKCIEQLTEQEYLKAKDGQPTELQYIS